MMRKITDIYEPMQKSAKAAVSVVRKPSKYHIGQAIVIFLVALGLVFGNWLGFIQFFPKVQEVRAAIVTANSPASWSGTAVSDPGTTASITPSANQLILLGIVARHPTAIPPTPTISGNGLTWVLVKENDFDTGGTRTSSFLFRAMSSSPSTGAITITFSSAVTGIMWNITEFDNVDTGGTNGSAAIVQSDIAAGTASPAIVTLAAFSDANNATYGLAGEGNTTVFTKGAGFTELVQNSAGNGRMLAEWRNDNDTTVDASGFSSNDWGMIGVEIKVVIPNTAPSITGTGCGGSAYSDTPDPVTEGSNVNFCVDWDDPDAGDTDVEIYVCKTTGITPGTGCDGGGTDTWTSVTGTTDDPENNSLPYTTTGADVGPAKNYHVYVCDDEPECSAVRSGTFTVNASGGGGPVTANSPASWSGTAVSDPGTTASITPSANQLILLGIVARHPTAIPPTPTISGNGLTWVLVKKNDFDTGGNKTSSFLFRAMSSSPSTGAITITFSSAVTGIMWNITEFDNVDTGGTNGSAAIVQSDIAEGTASPAIVTLAAFSDANNATYGLAGEGNTTVFTKGAGFTELVQNSAGNGRMLAEWRDDNDTTVDASGFSSNDWGMTGVEIKAAGAGSGGFPVVQTQAQGRSGSTPAVSHVFTLPASIAAGDLILIEVGGHSNDPFTFSTPSGYTELYEADISGSGRTRAAAYYKLAGVGETSVDIITSTTTEVAFLGSRIDNWAGCATGGVEVSSASAGSGLNPDPPSFSPSWGATDALWIATAHTEFTNADYTAGPSGYSGWRWKDSSSGGATLVSDAWLAINAATENPGVFTQTFSSPQDWAAYTIAVLPSGGSCPSGSVLTQSAYRFFANLDSTDVGSPLAGKNAPASLSASGEEFRLRMLVHVDTANLPQSGETFKLQFAGKGGGTCSSPSGSPASYTDITGSTAIAYNNNPAPGDGTALTVNANDPTHGGHATENQTYEEANNFTNSEASISVSEDGQWDFALFDNGAPTSTTYCLRIAKSDSSPLDSYGVYPEMSTVGGFSLLGSLISSTFDTGFSDGVKINSILWHGSFGDGTSNVKFQIATADCPNGATDAPACTTNVGWGSPKTGGDGAFVGTDESSTTYYIPSAPDRTHSLPTDHHNGKRYYRYLVELSRDPDSSSPVVNDIIINWSP